ncbi:MULTISPECIES: TonB-dependent receptor [unclassified Iodidimonas]|jgi:iron complex outermembrane receptor protein|uniref:TonB-dependent receptor n=1 Tax=unclassified Iodidimonas TaxID=2626145 RepID=UPI002482281B|nr:MULTISPECIES: TonB-dependent receptor [unclassified Iodidimonas]
MSREKAYRLFIISLASSTALHGMAKAQMATDQGHPGHDRGGIEEIVVSAHPGGRSRFEILQGTSVLAGEELARNLRGTIGDSLDGLPGLSQTSFGQGASRPIIRGLAGDRLRILINDLGTFDVATTSPDHAPAVDLATARKVEVIRGPATLMYGANAIAGVVNVIDDRVPRALPENGRVDGQFLTSYGTNGDEVLNSGALTANIAGGLMAHVNGFYRDAGNFKAPGFLRSDRERAANPLPAGESEPFGRAENSDLENWGVTGGLSYVGRHGFLGASVTRLDNNYGIPVELEEEEEEEDGEEGEEGVRIDIEQTRYDLIGEWTSDFLVFDKARFRFGYADYEQAELEGGEIGTLFLNDEWEGRIDLDQIAFGGWTGTSGLHLRSREFEAIGAEAFVPPNETFQWGLYSFQSYEIGPWHFDAGARLDRQEAKSDILGVERNFTGISLSAGASYTLGKGYLIGLNSFRTERAPNADELFSNGPHLATFTFELGDVDLGEETVKGLELNLKKADGPFEFLINGFYYDYSDFIFERFTGEEEDGLPVAQFSATNARFYGLELEADYELWRAGEQAFSINAQLDFVNAKETASDTPLPRIPPLSFTLGGDYESHYFDVHIAAEYVASQKDIGEFELPTDDYVNLTASLVVHPFEERDISLIIEGRNLADSDIRFHTSFLKDLVPAPGRTVRFMLRAGF